MCAIKNGFIKTGVAIKIMTHMGYVIICYSMAFLLLAFNLILSWSEWQKTLKRIEIKKSKSE